MDLNFSRNLRSNLGIEPDFKDILFFLKKNLLIEGPLALRFIT